MNVCKNLINKQSHPFRGVLQKNCSENFRKNDSKTSTVEFCDFSTKITLHHVYKKAN